MPIARHAAKPGPWVTAMVSMPFNPTSPFARSSSGPNVLKCSRVARSGTTPPCFSWSAIWLCTHSPTSPRTGSKSATAVSSHELSSAKIISLRCPRQSLVTEKAHALEHRHCRVELPIRHRLETKAFLEENRIRDVGPPPLTREFHVFFRRHHHLHMRGDASLMNRCAAGRVVARCRQPQAFAVLQLEDGLNG